MNFNKKIIYLSLFTLTGLFTVAGSVFAEDSKDSRVAVMPFDTVNFDSAVASAAREIFSSSMVEEGFVLIDNKIVDKAILTLKQENWDKFQNGQKTKALPALKEPLIETTVQPAVESDTDTPVTEESAPVTVTPADNVTTEQNAANIQPSVENNSVSNTESDMAIIEPDNIEIAKALNCDMYITTKIVKLGKKTQVNITMYKANGDAVDSKKMVAETEDDLNLIFDRIAVAFSKGIKPSETRDYDNATVAETNKKANLDRIISNHGLMLGGGMLMGDKANSGVITFGYEGIWEYNRLRTGIEAGFSLASEEYDIDFAAYMHMVMGSFLSRGMVSPYISGGAGLYLGQRPTKDSDSYDDEYSPMGFEFFPSIGLEFLHRARMRIHSEVRYMFILDLNGNLAHGPMFNIGLNF
ncbi:MAG: hypothetical protein JXR91_03230 [Deltaproteobacteria bacterium]|nr:hypothetical protein [Deltaproteobacteria bacterium]